MWNVIPFPTIRLYTPLFRQSRLVKLLNADAAGEPVVVAVEMRDGRFGVTPAVVPFTIVEVDEPQAVGFEPQRPDFFDPSRHHLAEGGRQRDVLGMVFCEPLELTGQRLRATYGVSGEMFHLWQQRAGLVQ